MSGYIDSRGVSYNSSYWRLIQIDVNLVTKKANFLFAGYKDQDARLAGKDVIGTKNYFINDDTKFDYYFAKHMAENLNLMQIGYMIATETVEHIGDTMEDGVLTPILKTFFEGAEDVL